MKNISMDSTVIGRTRYEYLDHTSINTPNYRQLKKLGSLPEHPFYLYHMWTTCNISHSKEQGRDYSYVESAFSPPTSTPGHSLSETTSRAVGKHHHKVSKKDLDLSVSLLELDKTLSFVAKIARTFTKSFKQLRRGDLRSAINVLRASYSTNKPPKQFRRDYWFKRAKGYKHPPGRSPNLFQQATDETAGAYLAYANAARPLLLDVESLLAIHEKGFSKDPRRFRVATTERVSGDVNQNVGGYDITGHFEIRSSLVSYLTWDSVQFAAMSQLGLTSPLETAWELTPLSYIFDYFINVSGWIASVKPPLGSRYLSTILSEYQMETGTWGTSPSGWDPPFRGEYMKHYKRRALGTSPPSFNPFDSLSFDLSVSQFANALSVLRKTVFR